MDANMLTAEAQEAIRKNREVLAGTEKYRGDWHAELVVICVLLLDELKASPTHRVD